MPKPTPAALVGVAEDSGPESFVHDRTLAPQQERYLRMWPSGQHPDIAYNGLDAADKAKKHKAKHVKLKHEPGAERYQRNPHEPIKIK